MLCWVPSPQNEELKEAWVSGLAEAPLLLREPLRHLGPNILPTPLPMILWE